MECACSVDICVDGTAEFEYYEFVYPAGKMFTCTECGVTYPNISWHIEEHLKNKHTGEQHLYRTCEHCYSLRQVFFSNGWYFGMIWGSMHDFIEETEGDLSVRCIRQLTPIARGRLLDMVQEYYEYMDEEC